MPPFAKYGLWFRVQGAKEAQHMTRWMCFWWFRCVCGLGFRLNGLLMVRVWWFVCVAHQATELLQANASFHSCEAHTVYQVYFIFIFLFYFHFFTAYRILLLLWRAQGFTRSLLTHTRSLLTHRFVFMLLFYRRFLWSPLDSGARGVSRCTRFDAICII